MKYKKCTLENEYDCDDLENSILDNVCDRLLDKNAFWAPLLKIIKPELSCPINKVKCFFFNEFVMEMYSCKYAQFLFCQGLYTIRNGTFDLSMFSLLPIDGIGKMINFFWKHLN